MGGPPTHPQVQGPATLAPWFPEHHCQWAGEQSPVAVTSVTFARIWSSSCSHSGSLKHSLSSRVGTVFWSSRQAWAWGGGGGERGEQEPRHAGPGLREPQGDPTSSRSLLGTRIGHAGGAVATEALGSALTCPCPFFSGRWENRGLGGSQGCQPDGVPGPPLTQRAFLLCLQPPRPTPAPRPTPISLGLPLRRSEHGL